MKRNTNDSSFFQLIKIFNLIQMCFNPYIDVFDNPSVC